MSAERRVPDALLGDSEATLRQVRGVLSDYGSGTSNGLADVDSVLEGFDQPHTLQELVHLLGRSYREIVEVIESLRTSRGLLEQAAMERLQTTHQKLAEVSSATEVAATGMLDGLDRSLMLVDQLEAESKAADGGDSPETRDELRDELHQLMTLLQFQDITSQQLGYASSVLLDIEGRMVRLAQIFDVRDVDASGQPVELRPATKAGPEDFIAPRATAQTCDPEASTLNAEGRQALADSIFE